MKAALLKDLKTIEVSQVETPKPKDHEILVQVEVCSICGSDVRTFNYGNPRVKFPTIIGHEMSGIVADVGSAVKDFAVGDRLAIGADVPSMEDDWSKNGMANLADINYAIGYQFPGGFAEYCLLNELTWKYGPVVKVPEHVSFAEASLTEPMACCINGLERAFMAPGKSVFIIGAGPIGTLLYRVATAMGAGEVVIVDQNQNRLDQIQRLGLKNAFHSSETPLAELVEKFTNGKGFDIVLTACSSPDAQEEAVELVAKRGVVNFFGGLPKGSRLIQLSSNLIHYKEAYLTGSHGSSPRQFKLAMNLIAHGRVKVDDLISHRYSLDEIQTAFATAQELSGLKIAVTPNT